MMKQNPLRRAGALLLSLALAVSLMVPALADDTTPAEFSVSLDAQTTITAGDEATLEAQVSNQPANTTLTYYWTNSDEKAVQIVQDTAKECKIKGVGEGTSTITVTVTATATNPSAPDAPQTQTKTASCTVTVNQKTVAATGISLDKTEYTLEGGKKVQLTATVTPSDATEEVTWESSDEAVAKVSNRGLVTAGAATEEDQTATITAKAGNVSATCEITVKAIQPVPTPTPPPADIPVEGVSITRDTLSIAKGGNGKLDANVIPKNATDRRIAWASKDPAIATVDKEGRVTGVAVGETIITATSVSDSTKVSECRVTVTRVGVTGVEISPVSQRLDVKGTAKLNAYITPSSAENQKVTWKSDDEKVVTVDAEGNLTAVAPGKTKVWVTTEEGSKTAACDVEVSGIVVSPESLTVMVNKTGDLTYIAYGAANTGSVTWEMDDEGTGIASVNSNGRVTGRSIGETEVLVRKGSYTAKAKIKVVENTIGVIDAGTVDAGKTFEFVDVRGKLDDMCRENTGAGLKYVSNLSVPTSQGTLYYGYVSPTDTGYGVGNEKYYYSDTVLGERTLSNITFVPRGDFSGTAIISYSGFSTENKSFSGSIRLEVKGIDDVVYATTGNTAVTFQAVDFNTVCQKRTGRDLSYITFELPASNRGTLYYHYSSQSPYAEKVTAGTQYFRTRTPYLDEITFVPAEGYTGTVRVNYRGVDTSGNVYTGRVTINITNRRPNDTSGDVRYTADEGKTVSFRASDFNDACRNALGETLSYVHFTLPPSSQGTLYVNYKSDGTYDSRVKESTRYYRTGASSISDIDFVPAAGVTDRVNIDFTAYSTGGSRFEGIVTIQYSDTGDGGQITYTTRSSRAAEFVTADFNEMCQDANGKTLDYVRFDDLPSSSRGTLYYNYSSSSSRGNRVGTSTKCYRSGSPSLSRVAFVPKSGYEGAVTIGFTGYDVDGGRFEGTVRIEVEDSGGSDKISYSVRAGGAVDFRASDFNEVCQDVTGARLNYVRFELPSSTRGELLYQYNHSRDTYTSKVSANTSYYRTGSNRQLDDVTFRAAAGYTGAVEIGYTATSTSGDRFSGTVEIQVSVPTASSIAYSTTSFPISLKGTDFRRACAAELEEELSYITFTSLPDPIAGRLYYGYTVVGSGTQVSTNTNYYYNGSPSLDQISFVPQAGYQGRVSFTYTGVDRDGGRVTGTVEITISNGNTGTTPTTPSAFTDMGNYGWASTAVEFLRQHNVVSGMGDGRFGPGQNIQRCDFTIMLCRAFNFNTGSTYSFRDVPTGSYYAGAVATAKDLGIVFGTDGRFMPTWNLSRQDAMLMLKQAMVAAKWNIPDGSSANLTGYLDSYEISDYARDAVGTMVQMGIVSGDSTRRLRPKDTITRAEMAVILYRALTLYR